MKMKKNTHNFTANNTLILHLKVKTKIEGIWIY